MRWWVGILALGGAAAIILGCAHGVTDESGSSSEADMSVLVEPAPEKGFNYPYILRIPGDAASASNQFLMVEPNNTGTLSDDLQLHLDAAKALTVNGIGVFVSRSLNLALLVPVFPRPKTEWEIYTHMLDRDVMLLREGTMKWLDLQLIAMIDDARGRLKKEGVRVDPKVLITGFSSSGVFANRFTMLHPDRVHAVACGGINGLLILPYISLAGEELLYPLGLGDYESITKRSFDLPSWCQVHQFIYMGAEDENDAVLFDDGYSDSEREIVFTLLGKQMLLDRWEKCQQIYRSSGARVTFNTYQGIGHGTDCAINYEILEFFRTSIDDR
jgi:hypothetical protein